MGALLIATRQVLQKEFNLDHNSIEVGFDGQPKPSAGEFFASIHPMNWTFPNGDWDLHEDNTIGVTLTLRLGFSPQDRFAVAVWLFETNGMEPRIRRVITAIHHNQALRSAANELISGGASGKIFTPLQVIRVENPKPQGPAWFNASPPEHIDHYSPPPPCGVSQTVVFGKAQRCQPVDDMD